jgi:hypothetical protein
MAVSPPELFWLGTVTRSARSAADENTPAQELHYTVRAIVQMVHRTWLRRRAALLVLKACHEA